MAEVRLVLLLVVQVLRVEDVVHRHQVLALVHDPRPRAPQLLHVAADAEEEAARE